MDVTFDFSDVDSFFEEGFNEVVNAEKAIGQESVDYAVEHGSYRDNTGLLRRSNKFKADRDGLTLFNDAESKGTQYAELVEGRGYEVLSGAILHAEKRLKEEFE